VKIIDICLSVEWKFSPLSSRAVVLSDQTSQFVSAPTCYLLKTRNV